LSICADKLRLIVIYMLPTLASLASISAAAARKHAGHMLGVMFVRITDASGLKNYSVSNNSIISVHAMFLEPKI